MKTKLFLSFLMVILIALISNFIFRFLMEKDFEEYVKSSREDRLYWVMAAVEGSYEKGKWDEMSLSEALHWGMMLGFDIEVLDTSARTVMKSRGVMKGLTANMMRRMESLVDMSAPMGSVEEYPLFMKGEEIGSLKVREIERTGNLAEKEKIFKRRGREFLVISFFIAGGGAVFLSFIFSTFLTKPVMKLKDAADDIAAGNFDVKVDIPSNDEIGKLAHSFNFMSAALKKEDDIRKHLTSNIAHELRTPLAIMKANFEGIVDGVLECSPKELGSLKEEVERLITLVEGIEDIARAEESFLKRGQVKEISLRDFLEKHIKALKNIAEAKGIGMRLLTSEDIAVLADADKLNTIVKNILINALKFTDSGEISVEYGAGGERFFIRIHDTGKGMDSEELRRIFERFYKGSHSEGRGIGLSIVRELVQALNGEVDVQSVPGEGSRFTVFFPLEREKA